LFVIIVFVDALDDLPLGEVVGHGGKTVCKWVKRSLGIR
jgi:hypothetical protein